MWLKKKRFAHPVGQVTSLDAACWRTWLTSLVCEFAQWSRENTYIDLTLIGQITVCCYSKYCVLCTTHDKSCVYVKHR